MVDPHRLKVLVALARHGTLAAAADALGYSQATLSHHLSRLEAETGAVLTQRVGRGLRLTDDGRRLAQRGEEILALLQRAEQDLAASQTLEAGRVRLAVFPSAASTVVPAVLTRMAQAHPGVEVDLAEAEPAGARELLRTGAADVAIVFGYRDDQEPPGFARHPLGDDALHLVTPTAGPLSRARTLAGHRSSPWIAGCTRCRAELIDLAQEHHFEPVIRFATDDYVAVQHLVAAGFAVAVLPTLALQAFRHPDVRTRVVPSSRRQLSAVTFGEPPHPPQVEAMLSVLARVRGAQV